MGHKTHKRTIFQNTMRVELRKQNGVSIETITRHNDRRILGILMQPCSKMRSGSVGECVDY